jgi:hypothetical protein
MKEITMKKRFTNEDDILIKYDIEESFIILNNKKLKIESDEKWTFKFLKTKIKCRDGIFGLIKSIEKNNEGKSFNYFHSYFKMAIEKKYI